MGWLPCPTVGLASGDYKKIINFSPMKKEEPKAGKRRCVQCNQTSYESSQPVLLSLDDSPPGFGDQSTLFLCGCRKIGSLEFPFPAGEGEKEDGKHSRTMVAIAAEVL